MLVILFSLIVSRTALAHGPNPPDAMVINIFELSVKAGKREDYDRVARQTISDSVARETGTLAMYSLSRKDNAHQTYMIEIYQNNQAYLYHLNAAPYRAFIAGASEIIDQKQQIKLIPQFVGDKRVIQRAATINNLVIVDVKPEFQQAFKNVVLPEMAASLKNEEGVLAMYAAIDLNRTNRWYFYEIYASDADYQQHRQQAYFRDYLARTSRMTIGKESVPVKPLLLRNKGGIRFIQ